MCSVLQNFRVIFKRIKLDRPRNVYDQSVNNNSLTCRRHFMNIINVNKPIKLYLNDNQRLFRFCRPVSSSTPSLCDKSSVKPNTESIASKLLAEKVRQFNEEDKSKSQTDKEEKEKTMRALKYSYYAFGTMIAGLGITLIYNYGSSEIDEDGNVIIDEFSDMPIIQQYLYRTLWGIKTVNKMMQEPTREKLLPDTAKEPFYQPPYTLVLEMKDILVHPEWTYATGWRFKKRPGVDLLLQTCSHPLFEVVIYTAEQGMTAHPVIMKLDTNQLISYQLFRDSTRYVDGKHLKDLNHLNRDLNKVIIVDWDKDAITTPRNQLCINRWEGDLEDTTLVDLAAFLKTIAQSEIGDVRDVLDYYKSFDDPMAAFRNNQIAAELQAKENEAKGFSSSSWSSSIFKKR